MRANTGKFEPKSGTHEVECHKHSDVAKSSKALTGWLIRVFLFNFSAIAVACIDIAHCFLRKCQAHLAPKQLIGPLHQAHAYRNDIDAPYQHSPSGVRPPGGRKKNFDLRSAAAAEQLRCARQPSKSTESGEDASSAVKSEGPERFISGNSWQWSCHRTAAPLTPLAPPPQLIIYGSAMECLGYLETAYQWSFTTFGYWEWSNCLLAWC